MEKFIFGAILLPALMTIFGFYLARSPAAWAIPLVAASVVVGGFWIYGAVGSWVDENGDSNAAYFGRLLSVMCIVYGGFFTAIGLKIAIDESKEVKPKPPQA